MNIADVRVPSDRRSAEAVGDEHPRRGVLAGSCSGSGSAERDSGSAPAPNAEDKDHQNHEVAARFCGAAKGAPARETARNRAKTEFYCEAEIISIR